MAGLAAPLAAVEEVTGYSFDNPELLRRAMTHSSLSSKSGVDLERLEFLGDRVLGLLTAEALWRRYPEMDEGQLAPRLNQLVRKETCADAARHFALGPAIRMSVGEERNGGRDRNSVLGDAMESLLGALYIDGGLEAASKVYNQYWGQHFDAIADQHLDAKTALQEWAQAQGHGTPTYRDVERSGPDHAPEFTVEVHVGPLARVQGKGKSKRDAQGAAAREILLREGVWTAQKG